MYNTPLQYNSRLSDKYDANIYIKREDLQIVRSYKIRGAYNKMSSLNAKEKATGGVCASAGNHAQGVALACFRLSIHCTIFMPTITPQQKIKKVKNFGGKFVKVELTGETFDEAYASSLTFQEETGATYIHPFNDYKVIAGQGTIGIEILDDSEFPIDFLFGPIGGGGFLSGISSVFKQLSPETKLIGVEPKGAPKMSNSFAKGKVSTLKTIDTFVDGAAVKTPGTLTFEILRKTLTEILIVPEGAVCNTILDLYNEEGIVTEPAGALTIASLEQYKEQIKGKNIVLVISGGNNDIARTKEIKRRAKEYNEELKKQEESI